MTELIRGYYSPLDIQRFESIVENMPILVQVLL